MPGILDDLIMVTAHLTAESIRTKQVSGTDVIATGVLVNPLVHRLYGLRLKKPYHCCRSETLFRKHSESQPYFISLEQNGTANYISSFVRLRR